MFKKDEKKKKAKEVKKTNIKKNFNVFATYYLNTSFSSLSMIVFFFISHSSIHKST